LVISTQTRRSVSQRLISASSSTVQTIVLIPARWHCATTPAAARRRCTATQSARQARSLRIGRSSLSRGRRSPGPRHFVQVTAERQRRGNRGKPRLDRGHRTVLQRRHDEVARSEDVQRHLDDLLLASGVLQVQVPGRLPGDHRHHVGHPRHRVTGQLTQPRVADGGQRVALAGPRVVEGGELAVGGPADVELDVLRAGRSGVRKRLDGPGPRAVRRNGRHL
jgi:hypothetical protein